ncbi:MAG: M4 family metallopeptidase [Deltaproteobacteria bacterium]|nr:M4 family metallopeptidase [Deltaproteobacteria bacterium]
MGGRLSTPMTTAPMAGAPFVGPHVFEEIAKRRAAQGDVQGSKVYLKQAVQADGLNLQRLKVTQLRAWQSKPPVIQRLSTRKGFAPEAGVEVPVEERIARFEVYDAKNASRASWNPKNLVRKKGDKPTGDEAVDDAYQSIVNSLIYYLEGLGINSIDAKGLVIKAAVHLGKAYNNAYYVDGTINFGDGDGKIFHHFAKDLTVVAHELGHGIVEMLLGGLTYWSQSGALNESFADTFGISALQYALGQMPVPEAVWFIGKTAMVPYTDKAGKRVEPALRSMSHPGTAYVDHPDIGTDSQPKDMDGYYTGSSDNYGVHINSGIVSRAFYLAATAIGGDTSHTLVQLWMDAARMGTKNANFKEFAGNTLQIAWNKYHDKPEIHAAIEKAWKTVKVLGDNAPDKLPPAYVVTSPAVLKIFGIKASEYIEISTALNRTNLEKQFGARKVSVGFTLNEKSEAELVVLAYVDQGQGAPLPGDFGGYKVVKMDTSLLS